MKISLFTPIFLTQRLIIFLLRLFGSMYFAVTLIVLLSIIMGWATFVDREFGSEASTFAVYSSWWFILLFSLLGASVVASAVLRFPWKRHQTGFLITHLGIVVLLAGCWMTLKQGKSAKLGIWEGTTNDVAVSTASTLTLQTFSDDPADKFRQDVKAYKDAMAAGGKSEPNKKSSLQPVHTTLIPFRPGPITWDFYAENAKNSGPAQNNTAQNKKSPGFFSIKKTDTLPYFPWSLAQSDRGRKVMYENNGIRLEVLDYRDSAQLKTPARFPEIIFASDQDTEMVELTPESQQILTGGISLLVHPKADAAAVAAFRAAVPDMSLLKDPNDALLTLYVDGKMHALPVSTLQAGQTLPLPETDWKLRVLRMDQILYIANLELWRGKETPVHLTVIGEVPDMSRQAPEAGIFGWIWLQKLGEVPENAKTSAPEMYQMMRKVQARQRTPRIEFMVGQDGAVYGKAWKRPVCETFTLASDEPAVVFSADKALSGTLTLQPQETPDVFDQVIRPMPLTKITDHMQQHLFRAAKIRLTVDGNTEQRWVLGLTNNTMIPPPPPGEAEVLTVKGKDRWVSATLKYEEIQLGIQLHLNRFNHRLDPGTSTAAGYSSDVTLLDTENPENARDLQIIINQPVDFYDARNRLCWRIYQTSFDGPFTPESPVFQAHVTPDANRRQLYLSQFNISYDPGRGWLYLGCFLIIAGIAVMFYMRAYFFGRE